MAYTTIPASSSGGGLSAIADQTTLANVSGSSAVPTATSVAQMQTMLSILATPASTGLTYFTIGSPGTVSSITTLTGLTATSSTLSNDFSTGKNGGLTVYGDTLTTGNLTLQPNFADTTTGRVIVNGIGVTLNAGNGPAPSINFGTANTGIYGGSTFVRFSVAGANAAEFGTGYVQAFGTVSGSGYYIGTSAGGLFVDGASGIYLAVNNYTTHRLNIPSSGNFQFLNSPYVSFTSASTAIAQSAGTVMEFGAVPPSQAAASGTKLDAYKFDAVTATFTTATNITTATGVNFIDVEAPTYTNASASAVTNAATFTIKGAPVAAGSLTITNGYALWVQAGATRIDGPLVLTNTLATPGAGVIVTTDAPSAVVSLSLKYIQATVNGTATYILALQ